jgi:hypothetical protein
LVAFASRLRHRRLVSEDSNTPRDWTGADLDLVVGDYFVMLGKALAGQPLDPAAHQRALRFVSGRSGAAIEWKQGEISAALTLIGVPILRDFQPRWKLADALLDAVDRCLTAKPAIITAAMRPASLFSGPQPPVLLEGPPPVFDPAQITPTPRAERLIAKFDPAARDYADRLLTETGQAAVLTFERRRLTEHGRPDLALQVRPTAAVIDVPGHDILSFKPTGEPRLVIVKTTTGGVATPFALTDAEDALWRARPQDCRIHRLYDLGRTLSFYRLRLPADAAAKRQVEAAL